MECIATNMYYTKVAITARTHRHYGVVNAFVQIAKLDKIPILF